MQKFWKNEIKILLSALLFVSVGCSNIFKAAANKDTDEAKLEDVRKLLNERSWDEALAKLETLSEAEKLNSSTLETWASVYAGKCGLEFATYFNNLSQASLGSTTMFKYLMNAFTGVSVDPTSCANAQAKIEQISSTPAGRTAGQNLFMAILGMVKIGTNLRSVADVNGTGNLGNGLADTPADGGTYDSCDDTKLTDLQAASVMSGLGLVIGNLTALTTALSGGDVSDVFESIDSLCSGSCIKTDPTQVSAAEILLIRNILATGTSNTHQTMGIDDTCNGDLTNPLQWCCL